MLAALRKCAIPVDGIRDAVPHILALKGATSSLRVPYHVLYYLASMVEGDKFGITGEFSNGKSFDEMYTVAVRKVSFRSNEFLPIDSALLEPEQPPIFSKIIDVVWSLLRQDQHDDRSFFLENETTVERAASETGSGEGGLTHDVIIKDLTETAPSPGLWRFREAFGRLPT